MTHTICSTLIHAVSMSFLLFTGALRRKVIECDCFHVQSGSNRWPTMSAVSAERQCFIFCTYTACSYVAGKNVKGFDNSILCMFGWRICINTCTLNNCDSAGREGRCNALHTLHTEFDWWDSSAVPAVLPAGHGPRRLQRCQTWSTALVSWVEWEGVVTQLEFLHWNAEHTFAPSMMSGRPVGSNLSAAINEG